MGGSGGSEPLLCPSSGFLYSPSATALGKRPATSPDTGPLKTLKPILEDPGIKKVGQNLKYEWIVLRRYGIELQGILCDTMIASYLLNPTKHNHNLSEIAREYLDISMTEYEEVVGTGGKAVTFDQVDLEKARDYSCEDAEVALQLSRLLLPKLAEDGSQDLYDQVEIPLLIVLAKMEMNGVKIDVDLLNEFSKEIENQLQQKMERIYALAGEEFNINSSQQLGKILFEKLKLPVVKKNQDGLFDGCGRLNETLALSMIFPWRSSVIEISPNSNRPMSMPSPNWFIRKRAVFIPPIIRP